MNAASITVRLPATEREEWERSANLAGVSLSEWIRKRCANGHDNGVRPPDPLSVDQQRTGAPERAARSARVPSDSALKAAQRTGHKIGCACPLCTHK
jgi:hypothetical protein